MRFFVFETLQATYPRTRRNRRLAGSIFIPLDGPSIYAAWRESGFYPAQRRISENPPNPADTRCDIHLRQVVRIDTP
ncbi:MAG: hypothetical protein D8H94_08565 [Cardiobacterium sp.]|nr:MAG: hypothetical protein D8H94_08565 [Cardiobacterium sp.]